MAPRCRGWFVVRTFEQLRRARADGYGGRCSSSRRSADSVGGSCSAQWGNVAAAAAGNTATAAAADRHCRDDRARDCERNGKDHAGAGRPPAQNARVGPGQVRFDAGGSHRRQGHVRPRRRGLRRPESGESSSSSNSRSSSGHGTIAGQDRSEQTAPGRAIYERERSRNVNSSCSRASARQRVGEERLTPALPPFVFSMRRVRAVGMCLAARRVQIKGPPAIRVLCRYRRKSSADVRLVVRSSVRVRLGVLVRVRHGSSVVVNTSPGDRPGIPVAPWYTVAAPATRASCDSESRWKRWCRPRRRKVTRKRRRRRCDNVW